MQKRQGQQQFPSAICNAECTHDIVLSDLCHNLACCKYEELATHV